MKRASIQGPFFVARRSRSNLILFFTVQLLQDIFTTCGLHVQRYEQVHGGDINKAYCLFTSQEKYFLKINDSINYPGMFQKEANGLDLLRTHCTLIVPKVFKTGESGRHQYLLLEWLENSTPLKNMWEDFGSGLAMMHKQPQSRFGLNEDNYIGSLKQNNTSHNEWHSFYSECRIMPLVKTLFDSGSFSSKDINNAASFCKNLKEIFPAEAPSLLHGDLWGGNFMIASPGKAAIVDPAVYFGHREMDIGMTKLFGGFDQRFYEAYNEVYPLENHWRQRMSYTQLYPLLVHAVLFGGHYIAATKNIFLQSQNSGSHM
ncbi:MAG TPA: fructosamine kinase family protein [Chitinophagaceae bacterium]|nr:fructosamine kinase family protein [Chitinophagaceae bacterium]